MDYGNMKFNEIEKEALIHNRKEICKWIYENIVPKMPHNTKIEIGFGGTYMCPQSRSKVPMYTLVVYSEPNMFHGIGGTSWKDEYIQIGVTEKFGRADNLENGYTSRNPYTIFPIVDNWRTIKSELEYRCSVLTNAKKNIFEFAV